MSLRRKTMGYRWIILETGGEEYLSMYFSSNDFLPSEEELTHTCPTANYISKESVAMKGSVMTEHAITGSLCWREHSEVTSFLLFLWDL